MSSVTFWMVRWSRRSCSFEGSASADLLFGDEPPRAGEEAVDALHVARPPRLGLLQRPHEHLVEPERVGPVRGDDVVGVDDVAAALRHLVRPRLDLDLGVGLEHEPVAALLDFVLLDRARHAVADDGVLDLAEDHALVDELPERLLGRDDARVVEHFVPEPGVEQVQHGVLGPADVEIDRHPVLLLRRVDEARRRCRGRGSGGSTSTSRPTAASCSSRAARARRRTSVLTHSGIVASGLSPVPVGW